MTLLDWIIGPWYTRKPYRLEDPLHPEDIAYAIDSQLGERQLWTAWKWVDVYRESWDARPE